MSRRGMVSILRRDRSDLDFVEHLSLQRAHLIESNQFEEREKRNDDFDARNNLAEQFRKAHRRAVCHSFEDLFDLLRNREAFAKNFLKILARFDALDHLLKGVDQLKNADFVQRQGRLRSW